MINKFSDPHMTTQMSLTEIMLALVRAAVLDQEPSIPANTIIDWDGLMDISQEQGLIAWVYDGICKLPSEQQPPRLYRINWGMSAQDIWDRYELQQSVLHDIASICEHHQMRLMLLKGIGLSNLFPKPQSRPSGDIDIYLFNDFEKGNRIFSASADSETELHSSFVYNGVEIENHKIFVYQNSKVKGLVGDYLLNHTSDVIKTDVGYYIFAPVPNLVYLLMHALNHVNYASEDTIFSIKHILDIGMFIKKNKAQLPTHEVLQVMRELLLDKSFELMIYLSEWMLRIDLKEYHHEIIASKDLRQIEVLFNEMGLSPKMASYSSLIMQIFAVMKRFFLLRPISKYIPKKPQKGLLRITLHMLISIVTHRLIIFPNKGQMIVS